MKLGKLTLGIITAATLIVVNCAAAEKTVSEESLGLRTTTIYTEDKTTGDKTQYGDKAAGTSTKIARAFENAPPMIPHDVEGMLPITIDNNQCTMCHEPSVAPSMGATPIPKTHFTSFRPETKLTEDGTMLQEGKQINNTSDIKTVEKPLETLAGARFNCSQCHAPQSEGTDAPKNNFATEFRSEGLNGHSNLIDTINEGVK
ncbi:nitrate reductase cytochrome c-type subunit [Arcobacter sp. s6]|uniref:nitrate reductase cytochrome c-type subunit n=1 Tax=Arcobacter sp. s6 TaxID=3230363 RepID=UPI00349FEDF6